MICKEQQHVYIKPAAIVVGITLLLAASTCVACIYESEASALQAHADGLVAQAQTVRSLAAQADTILIASAIQTFNRGRVVYRINAEFRIDKVLKGTMPASGRATYVVRPGIGYLCRALDAFLDTTAMPGQTYILYAKNGGLLRAGDVRRDWGDIALEEEIKLVADSST